MPLRIAALLLLASTFQPHAAAAQAAPDTWAPAPSTAAPPPGTAEPMAEPAAPPSGPSLSLGVTWSPAPRELRQRVGDRDGHELFDERQRGQEAHGFAATLDVPVHPNLSLGAYGAATFWQTEEEARTGAEQNLALDLSAVLKVRIPVNAMWETYFTAIGGATWDAWDDSHLQGMVVHGGFGWNVGLFWGNRLMFGRHLGIFVDIGGVLRHVEHPVLTARADLILSSEIDLGVVNAGLVVSL